MKKKEKPESKFCPKCGGTNITVYESDFDDWDVEEQCYCDDEGCDTSWKVMNR